MIEVGVVGAAGRMGSEVVRALDASADLHLAAVIDDIAKSGDIVVCLGAGNITAWAHALPADLAAIAKGKA